MGPKKNDISDIISQLVEESRKELQAQLEPLFSAQALKLEGSIGSAIDP